VHSSHVSIRQADWQAQADLTALTELWQLSRAQMRTRAQLDLPQQLRVALQQPGVSVYLADLQGRSVGFVVVSEGPLLPLLAELTVAVEHLYVHPAARRGGVAQALMARVLAVAEQAGASQVSSSVRATDRDGHRFFARLGFSPFVVRRVVPVMALRRRLTTQAVSARDATVVRRRSLRARSLDLAARARTSV
jgi:GNAT superfamily N-acetyltransferase